MATNTPVTRVSLSLTSVAVVIDAAAQLLKLVRVRGAAKGRAAEAIESSDGLEAAITDILAGVKEAIGAA